MKAICPSALRGTGVAVGDGGVAVGRGVGSTGVGVGGTGVGVGGTGVGVGGTGVGADGFGVAADGLVGCSVATGSSATSAGVAVGGGVARGLVDVQPVTSNELSIITHPQRCILVLTGYLLSPFLHLSDVVTSYL
jgi:hypothetical protein